MHHTSTSARPRRRIVASAIMVAGLSLVAAACGSDSKVAKPDGHHRRQADHHAHQPTTSRRQTTTPSDDTVDPPPGSAPTKPTSTTTPASGAIDGIDDAQRGTIQIVAQGRSAIPRSASSSGVGSGSGFFIDDNGLAVTNNHVVTGAATLEVFVGGDTTKSYNAHVLGVSECNDLAVIQVDAIGADAALRLVRRRRSRPASRCTPPASRSATRSSR